jgi:RNA-directed DNA polymerase
MGTGRNSPERVDGLKRNQWTEWIGMGGRISPEWVDGIGRNTHPARHPCSPSRATPWRETARRVQSALPKRFGRYGLLIHEEKTRLVDFRRPRGKGHSSASFDFLGFTHYWGVSRKKNWVVQRKTAKKKLKQAVSRVYQWCRRYRHDPVREQWRSLCRKLQGHYGFYGITFNSRSLNRFYEQVKRSWRKWLNRRCRDKDMPWDRFNRLLERYPLPRLRIVHKYA